MTSACLVLVGMLGGLLLVSGCSGGSGKVLAQDAATEGDSAVFDPHCQDGKILDHIPSGSCVTGASCQFTLQTTCKGDAAYSGSPQDYSCSCEAGIWSCQDLGGGLGLSPCDSGLADGH